jgi:hypothetical protein
LSEDTDVVNVYFDIRHVSEDVLHNFLSKVW